MGNSCLERLADYKGGTAYPFSGRGIKHRSTADVQYFVQRKRRKTHPMRSVQSLGRKKIDEVVEIFGEYRHRIHACSWRCNWNWCPNYHGWDGVHPDFLTYSLDFALANGNNVLPKREYVTVKCIPCNENLFLN